MSRIDCRTVSKKTGKSPWVCQYFDANGHATILDFIRTGDVVVVARVDGLAHSIADLHAIVRVIKEKGACLQATEQPTDTTHGSGECIF